MRPSLLVPLAIAAAAGCGRPPATPEPPTRVVEQFHEVRLRSKLTGAPARDELTRLAPFLSDTLRALLAAARRLHDAELARAPDEKPAFAEGDLFSSLFEGPTSFRVVTDSVSADGPVPVRFTYADGKDTTTWTDRVQVARRQGRYVVADVEYGGTWAFANGGSLRTSLEHALGAVPAARP